MYELYDEAGVDVGIGEAPRAINSDAGKRDDVAEIIATNVPDDERRGTGQQGSTNFGNGPGT
jgi:DNA adenine methylase